MKYDYLIVGAGLYGSVFAQIKKEKGYKCLIIDRRNHIAGNVYSKKIENIEVHMYGPHIFHTDNFLSLSPAVPPWIHSRWAVFTC